MYLMKQKILNYAILELKQLNLLNLNMLKKPCEFPDKSIVKVTDVLKKVSLQQCTKCQRLSSTQHPYHITLYFRHCLFPPPPLSRAFFYIFGLKNNLYICINKVDARTLKRVRPMIESLVPNNDQTRSVATCMYIANRFFSFP